MLQMADWDRCHDGRASIVLWGIRLKKEGWALEAFLSLALGK